MKMHKSHLHSNTFDFLLIFIKRKSALICKALLFVIICLPLSYAEDVKLSCSIAIEHRFSEGIIRRENVMASVDIKDNGQDKSITIATHKVLAFVSSHALPTRINYFDSSDLGRWNIKDIDYDPSDTSKSITQIYIDRNSGVISYGNSFEQPDGYIRTTGNGNCIKIDANTRKF